jgi:GNAT superfamily N-acetyltransferase
MSTGGNSFGISTDRSRLDRALVHGFLCEESYWASGRAREVVERSIETSLCFGLYRGERQVGFARVVTDHCTFAWLADVFVIREEGGRGLGKRLIEAVLAHPELQDVPRWLLGTADAHSFYERYGFRSVAEQRFMTKESAAPAHVVESA